MIRILRAFAWMRWRVLLNTLERTAPRDTLERLSLAVEQLGPIIAALLLVPSLAGMAALSGVAGYAVATGVEGSMAFEVLRYLSFGVSVLAIVGPIILPALERANPVRLLLLPIPRATLYVAQAAGALADPWTLVVVPIVFFLPLGLAVGGAVQAAALSMAAGVLFLLVLVGLATLTGCLVQLVMRDRRRGELVALVFILIVPLVGILANVADRRVSGGNREPSPERIERSSGPGAAARLAGRAFALAPSEQYVGAARAGADGRPATGTAAIMALAATAALLHGSALMAFGRILAFPGSSGRRRRGGRAAVRWRLPGLTPGASAVAIAQIRLALRTPRGRSSLLSPLVVFIVLAVVSVRGGWTPFPLIPQTGVGLAAFGGFFSILAILPLAMNQFAIDGAGLTLELLSPLSDGDLIDGKAAANAALAGTPALLCLVVALVLAPTGAVALWISVPLAIASMYLLVAPVSAAASAVFPRVVDLNSVGRGSNAHGAAGLIGLAAAVLSGLPSAALAFAANGWLKRPGLTPILLLVWCVVTFGLNRLLSRPVRAILAKRRENLGLVAR